MRKKYDSSVWKPPDDVPASKADKPVSAFHLRFKDRAVFVGRDGSNAHVVPAHSSPVEASVAHKNTHPGLAPTPAVPASHHPSAAAKRKKRGMLAPDELRTPNKRKSSGSAKADDGKSNQSPVRVLHAPPRASSAERSQVSHKQLSPSLQSRVEEHHATRFAASTDDTAGQPVHVLRDAAQHPLLKATMEDGATAPAYLFSRPTSLSSMSSALTSHPHPVKRATGGMRLAPLQSPCARGAAIASPPLEILVVDASSSDDTAARHDDRARRLSALPMSGDMPAFCPTGVLPSRKGAGKRKDEGRRDSHTSPAAGSRVGLRIGKPKTKSHTTAGSRIRQISPKHQPRYSGSAGTPTSAPSGAPSPSPSKQNSREKVTYEPRTLESYKKIMEEVSHHRAGGLGPADTDEQRLAREKKKREKAYGVAAERATREALKRRLSQKADSSCQSEENSEAPHASARCIVQPPSKAILLAKERRERALAYARHVPAPSVRADIADQMGDRQSDELGLPGSNANNAGEVLVTQEDKEATAREQRLADLEARHQQNRTNVDRIRKQMRV